MPQYRVAVVGGGIGGLCLAVSIAQLNAAATPSSKIQVNVYEAANEIVEVGAGLTLWGRVCDVLRDMGLADECVRSSVIVASSRGESTTDGFKLRGFRDDADYGRLPFRDAWSIHRTDLIAILVRHVPRTCIRLGKRLVSYSDPVHGSITLTFADHTTATCDILVGADGLRSVVRGQMMRDVDAHASSVGVGPGMGPGAGAHASFASYVHPRWTGTIAYRALVPLASIRARNPAHPMLRGGVVYFGKSRHIVGYPISPTTLNLAINTTNLAHVDTPWPPPRTPLHDTASTPLTSTRPPNSHPSSSTYPSPSSAYPTSSTIPTSSSSPLPSASPRWHVPHRSYSLTSTSRKASATPHPAAHRQHSVGARELDRGAFRREVAPQFACWGREVDDIIESVGQCMEWPVMDLNPLPFYTRGRVVVIGDAAHAAVPYVGAGAAFAIEDAYILSHLLHAAATTRSSNSIQLPPPHSSSRFSPHSGSPLTRALTIYDHLRRPRGNALVRDARLALRSFQFDGPSGADMRKAAGVVCKVFEAAAGVGEHEHGGGGRSGGGGPEEDVRWGIVRVKGMA